MKSVKNTALAIIAGVIALTSCKKDGINTTGSTTDMPEQMKNAVNIAGRVTQPGVVYVPLNITIQANTNVYAYTWVRQVDLDQDSLPDFDLKTSLAWSAGADFYQVITQINALQPGGGTVSDWSVSALSGMPYVWSSRPLPLNTVIGTALTTYANPSDPSTYAYSRYFGGRNGGLILGKGDKYVGMKFVSAGQTYFGWFRVNITNGGKKFVIKDAAFNNTAGSAIMAGQMQ